MHTVLKLHHVNSQEILLNYIERRLKFVLSRFGPRVDKVTTRISASGAGASDPVRCCMMLDLHPFGRIQTEAIDDDVFAAIDRCAARLARRCESKCARSRDGRGSRLSIRTPDNDLIAA